MSYTIERGVLLTARVRHPQQVSVTPVKPWVTAEKNETVICAHCTCMAGLGEACSHISALMFVLEANTNRQKTSHALLNCAHGCLQACRKLNTHQLSCTNSL